MANTATPAAPPMPSRPAPVSENRRIDTMDVLRGLALLGIFCVNIRFFSMPFASYFDHVPPAGSSVLDGAAFYFVKIFCEGRFYILFSTLFGMGLVLQNDRVSTASTNGGGFVAMYLRRLFALFLFGVAHVVLFWYGDILIYYSIIALITLMFRNAKPRTLLAVAIGIWIFYGVIATGLSVLQAAFAPDQSAQVSTPDAPGSATAEPHKPDLSGTPLHQIFSNFQFMSSGPDAGAGPPFTHPIFVNAETDATKNGPFAQALGVRAFLYGMSAVFSIFSGFVLSVLAMQLFGAALVKFNFFAPARAHWHRRMLVVGLLIGIPAGIAVCFGTAMVGPRWAQVLVALGIAIAAPLTMFAYLGGVTLLVNSGFLKPLTSALACCGRMAFTNYLSQSVLTTFVMYHWGLGKFGDFSPAAQILYVFVVWSAQVASSVVWLKFFRLGPLEWVWRTLTYLKAPPLLR